MDRKSNLALILGGGGARAAYQVGFMRWLAQNCPGLRIPIINGVSAGAINAAHLSSYRGTLAPAVDDLTRLWSDLSFDHVFNTDFRTLWFNVMRWAGQLVSGGSPGAPHVRSLLETGPLREPLEMELQAPGNTPIPGIAENILDGHLEALALSTINYGTGQTVTWVQGREILPWSRPNRSSEQTEITVDHVMASAALPVIFPAQKINHHWFGDGGIRLSSPLAPAIHLGAERIIAISTRFPRTQYMADKPVINGYPPLAQVGGVLMNAVFLDALEHDAHQARRFNRLLRAMPEDNWGALRPLELLILRPSEDLGRLSAEFEKNLPKAFRFLTRGLGTRDTKSPDMLAMLMFHPGYLQRLIEIGEKDAESNREEILQFLTP